MRSGQGSREHVVSAGSQGQACTPCVFPPGHPVSPGGPVPEGSSLCQSDNKHSNSFSSSHSCPLSGFSIREIRKSLHHRRGRAPVRRLIKRVPIPSQLMVPVLVGSLYWQPWGKQVCKSSRRFQETFPSSGDSAEGEGMAPGPSTASARPVWPVGSGGPSVLHPLCRQLCACGFPHVPASTGARGAFPRTTLAQASARA